MITDTTGDDGSPMDPTTHEGGAPPPPPTPTPTPERPARLTRSADRKIAGVAGGIAEYFQIDPVIVRLGFVIAMFAGGTGLLAYAIAWIVLPESTDPPTGRETRIDRSTVLAVALLILAVGVGLRGPFDGGIVTALLLLGAGLYLLHQRPDDAGDPPDPSPAPDGTRIHPPASAAATGAAAAGLVHPPPPPHPSRPADDGTDPAPRAPRPPSEPATITRLTLSALTILAAAAIAFHRLDWIEADASTVMAIGLLVVGAASVVAAFIGRGRGLIPLGIVLALAFAGALAVEPVIEDGVGERSYAPTSVESLEPSYRLGIGELTVDLSSVVVPDDTVLRVEVELGIGEATVIVPPDIDLELEGDVGIGEVRVLDAEENGIRNQVAVTEDAPGDRALIVDLVVGIGEGRISRG